MSDALTVNSTLIYLRIEENEFRDAGFTRLSEAIEVNTSLQQLSLASIRKSGATRLSEALMVNTSLFNLHLEPYPESLPSHVMHTLLWKPGMNRMEMLKPRIINNDPNLTALDLRDSSFSEAAIASLCDALMLNSTVTSLDLTRGYIGDFGAARLAEVLKMNFSLTMINLRKNKITDRGVEPLAEALKMNSTLTHLDVGENKFEIVGKKSP